MHDLVIRGGTLIDGSGGSRASGDLAVDGDRIAQVGGRAGPARRELDASGLLVAPGFVDVHTHYDGQATWDPLLTPSSWHGVTTVVMGNCGVGFAPVRPDERDRLIRLMEGVEDIPGTALHEGIRWEWESFPEYLDALARRRFALDVGAQLPHAALRTYAMGERGADHGEAPSAAELEQMARLARDAMLAGALGFSSSRTVNHRSSDGRHTPSLTASREELVGIARGLREAGRGVIEIVCDFDDLDAEFALLRAMVEASGRPMSISTMQNPARPEQWRRLLALIDEACRAGLPMRGQVAPRAVGSRRRCTPSRPTRASSPSPGCRSTSSCGDCATPSCAAASSPSAPRRPSRRSGPTSSASSRSATGPTTSPSRSGASPHRRARRGSTRRSTRSTCCSSVTGARCSTARS
jgi:N-acyl-D-aspartate/D-glutamate deacylase